MKFNKTKISNIILITHNTFKDNRGEFSRLYCKKIFKKLNFSPVQTNLSINSKKFTLRGFHYQIGRSSEKKLVTCVKGEIYNVVIDLRKNSKTYGKNVSFRLSEKKIQTVYVPKGFANAFLTLKDNTVVVYHTNNYYNFEKEKGIRFDDKFFRIKWPTKPKIISNKDKGYKSYVMG